MTSIMNKRIDQLTVAELVQILNEHAPSIPSVSQKVTKSGKVKKVKDPNAPKKEVSDGVKAWNATVGEVLEDMKKSDWTHPETGKSATRKDAMAEASKRKAEGDPEYAAKAEARKQKRDSRKNSDASQHEEAAKEATKEAAKVVPVEAPVAEKPKKPTKAKKEEKKAVVPAAPSLPPSPVASPVKGKKAAKAVPAPAPAPIVEEDEEWIRKTVSGKKYLWNPSNNHFYRCEADGSQGEWAGLYDPKSGKIDNSVEEPVEFEE
jgi:hypothetical protein